MTKSKRYVILDVEKGGKAMDFNDFLEILKNLIVIGYTAWKWSKDYNKKPPRRVQQHKSKRKT